MRNVDEERRDVADALRGNLDIEGGDPVPLRRKLPRKLKPNPATAAREHDRFIPELHASIIQCFWHPCKWRALRLYGKLAPRQVTFRRIRIRKRRKIVSSGFRIRTKTKD